MRRRARKCDGDQSERGVGWVELTPEEGRVRKAMLLESSDCI
jgi:hypothetical protein